MTTDGEAGMVITSLGGTEVTAEAGTITGLVHLGGMVTEVTTTTTEGTHVQYPGVDGWLTHWQETEGTVGMVVIVAITDDGTDDGILLDKITTIDGELGIVMISLVGTEVTKVAGTMTGLVQVDGISDDGTKTVET
jgi:hypothetical protein